MLKDDLVNFALKNGRRLVVLRAVTEEVAKAMIEKTKGQTATVFQAAVDKALDEGTYRPVGYLSSRQGRVLDERGWVIDDAKFGDVFSTARSVNLPLADHDRASLL